MPIEKSESYIADLKARKLFGRMHAEIVALGSQIENLMTAANGMRLALGAATLTLAEVEALHVEQSHSKRTNDSLLFEAQTQLSELLDTAKVKTLAISSMVGQQAPKVEALRMQADRINTRDIVDDEPTGPVEGVAYVNISYFKDKLNCSMTHVRNLVTKGVIPQYDAIDTDTEGRPKFLWETYKANAAILRIENGAGRKRGIAALV